MEGRNHICRELETLCEQVGGFIQYWGFKKIHGRIWTHLYLSSEPLDAGTLMKRLKVSKALMSLSLHDLLDHNVILEAGKSDRGTQTYVANPNVVQVIINVLRLREKKMLAETLTAWRLLEDIPDMEAETNKLDPQRIERLGQMIQTAQSTLDDILELSEVNLSTWQRLSESGSLPGAKS